MKIEEQRKLLLRTMARLRGRRPLLTQRSGLPDSEFFLLHAIDSARRSGDGEECARASELGEHMHMSAPAVSQVLRSLENKGLIDRRASHTDRRVVYIRLSAEGERVLQRVYRASADYMDRLITAFGTERTDQLLQLLNELCDCLDTMTTRKDTAQ